MKTFTTLFALLLILSGCGRSAFFNFTSSKAYSESLPYTKRAEITDKFESKALMSASYLSAIYPEDDKYNQNETFLVGLYIENDLKKEKAGINNPLYQLTLNDKPFISAIEVDKNDELLKIMPLINRWSLYYIVEFDKNSSTKTVNLNLTHLDTNKSATISFPATF